MHSLRPSVLVAALATLATFACATADSPTQPERQPANQPTATDEQPADEPAAVEPAAVENAEPLCELGERSDWKSCVGQQVRVEGNAPEFVMQHPLIGGASPDPAGPQSFQTYMDAEGAQFIVVSNDSATCSGPMTVVGSLRHIDLGGDPSTKGGYQGWALEGATITCR